MILKKVMNSIQGIIYTAACRIGLILGAWIHLDTDLTTMKV